MNKTKTLLPIGFIIVSMNLPILCMSNSEVSSALFIKQYKSLSSQAKADVKYNLKTRNFDAFRKTIKFSQFCVRFLAPMNIVTTVVTTSLASASAYYDSNILRYSTVGSSILSFATSAFYEFFKKKLKHTETWLTLQSARDMVVDGANINSIILMI